MRTPSSFFLWVLFFASLTITLWQETATAGAKSELLEVLLKSVNPQSITQGAKALGQKTVPQLVKKYDPTTAGIIVNKTLEKTYKTYFCGSAQKNYNDDKGKACPFGSIRKAKIDGSVLFTLNSDVEPAATIKQGQCVCLINVDGLEKKYIKGYDQADAYGLQQHFYLTDGGWVSKDLFNSEK